MNAELGPRIALGDDGFIGSLYNAYIDKIDPRTLLKRPDIPDSAIKRRDQARIDFEVTTSDTLEQKFSKMNVSGQLQGSILCGLLTLQGSASYLDTGATSIQSQSSSIIYEAGTAIERLVLTHDVLKDIVDLNMLSCDGITHVITGIDWGARCIITATWTETHTTNETKIDVGGRFDKNCRSQPANSFTDIMKRMASSFGSASGSTSLNSDNQEKIGTSSFKFKIRADVKGNNDMALTYDEVKSFTKAIPAALGQHDGGKGVPLRYHLTPISTIAEFFKVKLDPNFWPVEDTILHDFVSLFDDLNRTRELLDAYNARLKAHAHCIPREHSNDITNAIGDARRKSDELKRHLRTHIVGIRRGEERMDRLQQLLSDQFLLHDVDEEQEEDGYSEDEVVHEIEEEGSSAKEGSFNDADSGRHYEHKRFITSLGLYEDKMDFVDDMMSKGAKHLSASLAKLSKVFEDPEIGDVYLFHFDNSLLSHEDWIDARAILMEILLDSEESGSKDCVLLLDYDLVSRSKASRMKGKSSRNILIQDTLKKPLLQKSRGRNIIVSDVVADYQALSQSNILRRKAGDKLETEFDLPESRREVELACPGRHCKDAVSDIWLCANCAGIVFFGYTDEYLYCQCGRYKYCDVEYKCSGKGHGSRFVQADSESRVLDSLRNLSLFEEHNILLLGQTGIGKSTFINAFLNYLNYETLNQALRSPDALAYDIPFQFAYHDENNTRREVRYGNESVCEIFSFLGKSGTQKCESYPFCVDGKVFRFIDTPGICDPRGVEKDHDHIRNILDTLEHCQNIRMVLFLLEPNVSRLTPAFEFCMRELLSRLHKSAARNIVFGFTKSAATNFRLSSTDGVLRTTLEKANANITLGHDNMFFFDALGFQYLAAFKASGHTMPRKEFAEMCWKESVANAKRLLKRCLALPKHEASRTLAMNRIRIMTANMTEPMVNLSTTIQMNLEKISADKSDIAQLTERTIGMGDNLWLVRKRPVRHDLPQPLLVCTHADCHTTEVSQGHTIENFPRPCHENCREVKVDGIVADPAVGYCKTFYRWWCWWVGTCSKCTHGWKLHKRLSFKLRVEEVLEVDQAVQKSIEEENRKKGVVQARLDRLLLEQEELIQEQSQIQDALTKFWLYLSNSSLSKYNDATIMYLDQIIALAEQSGDKDGLQRNTAQKRLYEAQKAAMEAAIARDGIEAPDERILEDIIQELYRMPRNGKTLSEIMPIKLYMPTPDRPEPRAVSRWRSFKKFIHY
ncbi:hypothetical protein NQ176_g379 [Zarea fungicola]|uniref:Uncharacterized protein n=1 Tax=Zarea fungicola TaxID=93591 RepID=A0ACC1NY97_9HYPO|nr:hypothetical protein NQ176_g379 [Lecanicillium fungicola]